MATMATSMDGPTTTAMECSSDDGDGNGRRHIDGWHNGDTTAAMDSNGWRVRMAVDGTTANGNNSNGQRNNDGKGQHNGDSMATEGTPAMTAKMAGICCFT